MTNNIKTTLGPVNVPVLLIAFSRYDTTVQVIEALRKAKVPRVYFACDGGRDEEEWDKVNRVRSLADQFDWDCEIKTLFRKENLGCGEAVNGAITWFFDNVEAGIILEDDTVPEISFFSYCEELLTKYMHDDRIGMISGNNHLPEYKMSDSYLFSKFKWTWGWATWRRAWANQDQNLKMMSSPAASNIIKNMGYEARSQRTWKKNLNSIAEGRVNTWDYHWFLAMSAQNQLSIIPRHNLVANIGFGVEGATHCSGGASVRYTVVEALEQPLKHPEYVVPDYKHEMIYESLLVNDGRGYGRFIPKFMKESMKQFMLLIKAKFR